MSQQVVDWHMVCRQLAHDFGSLTNCSRWKCYSVSISWIDDTILLWKEKLALQNVIESVELGLMQRMLTKIEVSFMDIGIRVPLFSSVTYHEPFIGEPDAISQFTINHWQTIDCLLVWSLDLVRNLSAQMWCNGSKLVACKILLTPRA